MDDCASTDSLRNYNYDCLSTKSFYSDDCTDATLQAELSGLILKDVDMKEYVQHVYGVSKADIEYIRSKGWQIEGLSTYTKLLDEDAKEEVLYGSFKTMMDDLFSTFTGDGLKLDVHYVSLGKTTLNSIGNVRKPEQLFFFGAHDDKSPVTWSLTKAFVELAVTPLTQRIAASNPTVATINEERATTTATEVLTDSAADLAPFPPLTSRLGSNEGIAKEGGNKEARSDKAKGEAVVEKVWSHFKITGDPLYVYGGLAGRGSHVLPGDLVEETPSQNRAEGMASNGKQVAESKPEGAMKARRNADLLASTRDDDQGGSMQEPETPMKLDYSDDGSDDGSNNKSDDAKTEDSAPPHESKEKSPPVNVDFETLGGCLTFENFMNALSDWTPREVPKKYQEHAERLLAEEPIILYQL
ncbi:hypothetical protein EYR40_010191 [Pleurotus pulmonarius]|nr:hypothetical protein EYR40_010191 [Pleurotus pulmonarius]